MTGKVKKSIRHVYQSGGHQSRLISPPIKPAIVASDSNMQIALCIDPILDFNIIK